MDVLSKLVSELVTSLVEALKRLVSKLQICGIEMHRQTVTQLLYMEVFNIEYENDHIRIDHNRINYPHRRKFYSISFCVSVTLCNFLLT